MARNTAQLLERRRLRNAHIVARFRELTRKNPHFKTEYVLGLVADEYFLSPVTVVSVIRDNSNETVPTEITISRRFKKQKVQQMMLQLL